MVSFNVCKFKCIHLSSLTDSRLITYTYPFNIKLVTASNTTTPSLYRTGCLGIVDIVQAHIYLHKYANWMIDWIFIYV